MRCEGLFCVVSFAVRKQIRHSNWWICFLFNLFSKVIKWHKFRSPNAKFQLLFFRFTDLLPVCDSQNICLVLTGHWDWHYKSISAFPLTGPGLFWAIKDLPRCLAGVCRGSGPEDIQVTKTKFAWFLQFKFLWTWQDSNLPVFGECFHKNILWPMFWEII